MAEGDMAMRRKGRNPWMLCLLLGLGVLYACLGIDSVAHAQDVTVDNRSASTSQVGTWEVSGGTNPYNPADPNRDSVWARGGDDRFTFHFYPTESGNYEVWEWHSGWSSRTNAAPHLITHAGGSRNINVNQQVNAGRWNSLGVYAFEAGGSYEVTITSTVSTTASTCADAVRWTRVAAANASPVALIDSITPNPANVGQDVTFTGHGTDADGSVTAYLWNIDGVDHAGATYTASFSSAGTYTVSFRVQDDDGAWSAPATASVAVGAASVEVIRDNRDSNTSQTGTWEASGATDRYSSDSVWGRGADDTFTWFFTAPQSGTYQVWEWHSSWSSRTSAAPHSITHAGGTTNVTVNQKVNGGRWNSLGVYSFQAGTTYGVTVTSVADNSSTCADAMRWTLVQASGNSAPTAAIDSISPSPAAAGDAVTFTGHGTDTDGTIAAYEWSSSIDGTLGSGATVSTSDLSVGSHTISFRVQDDDGAWSTADTSSLTVQAVTSNSPPAAVIDSIAPSPATLGETVTFMGHGTDTDGTIAAHEWSSSIDGALGSGATVSTSGLSAGNHSISFRVQDDDGAWSTAVTRSLTVSGSVPQEIIRDNRDPNTAQTGTWEVSGATNAYGADSVWGRGADDTFTWYFTAPQSGSYQVWEWHSPWSTRTTRAPFSVSHAGGSTAVTVNQQVNGGQWNSLGVYNFQAGVTYGVTLTSVADNSSTCADAIRWTQAAAGNLAPTASITSIGPNPATVGQSVSFAGSGSDTDGSIAAYRWRSSLNGTLSGNSSFSTSALTAGTHTITFDVQDDDGAWSAPVTWTLTVNSATSSEEHIYICLGYGAGINPRLDTQNLLKNIGAVQDGTVWRYTNAQQKKFVFHIVEDMEGMRQALMTSGAHVIYKGHANYGLGALFANSTEQANQLVENVTTIDDPRIFNFSSEWIHVNIRGIIASQAFPNWWPKFQDGSSGIMPYDFNDPPGNPLYDYTLDPPYNYYITYQLPGDSTHYKAETVRMGGIERFPDSGKPAWYSPTGSAPNPQNPDQLQYYLTNPTILEPALDVRGAWTKAYDLDDLYRDDYLYSAAGTGSDQVEYFFTITNPGDYKVYAWWPASPANTSSARYVVSHAPNPGTSTVRLIDQRTGGGQWNEIGQFPFEAGKYSVVISDQTGSGRVVADGIRVAALVNPPAVIQADFNANVRYGTAPLEVTFDSTSTGDITSFQWSFGDNTTNTTRDFITHTYTSPGTYTVTFTVNGPGGSSTKTKAGYIVVGDGAAQLRAEFTGSGRDGTIPRTCRFTDMSSGQVASWEWDFNNDGVVDSTLQNPSYTYTTPGNYTVSLKVRDALNRTSTETKTNFVVAKLYDTSLDNVQYPKSHYRSKTILFRKELEIPKDQLRFSRLYYEACNSGNYFLDTFNRGVVFYTLNTANGMAYGTYLRSYVQGKSDQQIWEAMQKIEPVYDFYNFNKKPSEQ
jgi:PKD repeat protein